MQLSMVLRMNTYFHSCPLAFDDYDATIGATCETWRKLLVEPKAIT